MTRSPLSRALLASALCALAALGACAAPQDAPALRAQIEREVGDAACQAHAQCRTLALGHKACGGPERWIAWSTARSDERRLAELAQRYAQARQAEHAASGRVSNCMVEPDPGAQCVAQRCVTRNRSSLLVE